MDYLLLFIVLATYIIIQLNKEEVQQVNSPNYQLAIMLFNGKSWDIITRDSLNLIETETRFLTVLDYKTKKVMTPAPKGFKVKIGDYFVLNNYEV